MGLGHPPAALSKPFLLKMTLILICRLATKALQKKFVVRKGKFRSWLKAEIQTDHYMAKECFDIAAQHAHMTPIAAALEGDT